MKHQKLGWIVFAIVLVLAVTSLWWVWQRQSQPSTTTPSSTPISVQINQLPIAVSLALTETWFNQWATPPDLLVIFGERENFADIPELPIGKLAWNVASFAHVKDTQAIWQGKINVILYDYELWDKTPEPEQADPEGTARDFQVFADDQGVELIFGTSFRMATRNLSVDTIRKNQGTLDWEQYVDKERIQKIARHVKNFGTNATGLRAEYPDSYVDFFKTVARYAKEVNPDIQLWPVLDARYQSAQTMVEMVEQLEGDVGGIVIMGGMEEQAVISDFIDLLRSANKS